MRHALLLLLVIVRVAAGQAASVEAVGMTVGDLDRSVAFFRDVLAFRPMPEVAVGGARTVRATLGDEAIDLTEYATAKGKAFPAGLASNDRSFQHVAIVVSDMRRAFDVLSARRVELITKEPQRLPDWNPNAGGIEALYFRDPDGHPLEIIRFPAGKGDPRWHKADGRLFLGIDHTAIVVADTEASLVFYRDLLGMQVVGGSVNWGPEQERLNVVPGARLRITTLRAPRGFGVELLEYLDPMTGRPMPDDVKPNDVLHRETVIRVAPRSTDGPRRLVPESRPAPNPHPILVRDPDGHVVKLVPSEEKP